MNAVNLVGRLVADPELKNSQKGRSYCRMRIAVTGRRSKGDSNPEALYVDDTERYHGPAAELGIVTHHFRGVDGLRAELDRHGLLP